MRADLGALAQKVTVAATKITVKPNQNPQTFIAINLECVLKPLTPLATSPLKFVHRLKSVSKVTKPAKAGYQNWIAHLVMHRNFFSSARALPSKTTLHSLLAVRQWTFAACYSLFAAVQPVANRQSLIAAVLARQEPRPPISMLKLERSTHNPEPSTHIAGFSLL